MNGATDRLNSALAGRYQIERQLGQGGMATVYLAQDLKHTRHVAIKVLKPELAAVLGAERFVQEIQTTAQLQHPHILPLFDSGQAVVPPLHAGERGTGGEVFLYYVMPYIEGETLRDKLNREKQLGIDEAIQITREVADALDYAHRHGVIHRDIKPENILLHDGRPMVADFGIALAVSAAAGGRMTETGLSLGTPHYMSPEQATADRDITARSDVYSLASVLYEMLAGEPPHMGNSAQQIIMKIIAEPAQLVTKLRKNVPANVAAALAKALEKLPADRFDSAKAFAEALTNPSFHTETITASGALAALPPYRRPALLTAALVLALAAAAWGWLRPAPASPVSSYQLAMPTGMEPTPGANPPRAAPDGSYLLYIGPSTDARGQQIWMKSRGNYAATPVAGTAGAASFAISPDSRSAAFLNGNGSLKIVSLAGGMSSALVTDSAVSGLDLAWLDGDLLAYVSLGRALSLRVVPVTGGTPAALAVQDSTGLPATPAGVPGTPAILFSRCISQTTCDLWGLASRTDSAHLIVRNAVSAQVVSRYLLYLSGTTLLSAPFDSRHLRTTGPAVPLADSVLTFSVSRSGTLVEMLGATNAGATYEMDWVDRSGHLTPVDTSWTFRLTNFASNAGWSLGPGGHALAIGLNGQEGDDIWVKPLPKGPASRITFDPSSEYRPHWAPDGRHVLFIRSGNDGVYLRRADGTGRDSLIRGSVDDVQEAVLSPDNQWLLMRQGGNVGPGGRDIVGMRLGRDTATVPIVATRYDEDAIALSRDGHWIAYQSDETGTVEVFVRPFPGTDHGKWQVSSGGGVAPLWSTDGRELFYLSGRGDMMAVRVSAASAQPFGAPSTLFHVPEDLRAVETAYYTPWDVAPDGRFIMARRLTQSASHAETIVVTENVGTLLNARMRK